MSNARSHMKSILKPSAADTENRCEACLREFDTAQGLAHHYTNSEDCHTGMLKNRQDRKIRQGLEVAGFPSFFDKEANIGAPRAAHHDEDAPRPRKRSRVVVEDVPEEENLPDNTPIETVVEEHPHGGTSFGRGVSDFEARRAAQEAAGEPACSPFPSYPKYELVKWMMEAVPSMGEVEKGLKLGLVGRSCILGSS